MCLASTGQQRLDADINAGGDVGCTVVTGIGQQSRHFAEVIGQGIKRGEDGR